MKRRSITTCCMTFLICLSCIEVAPADEPAERFLQALRENGYYDIALDYLESISDSPAVSDDFKKILRYFDDIDITFLQSAPCSAFDA